MMLGRAVRFVFLVSLTTAATLNSGCGDDSGGTGGSGGRSVTPGLWVGQMGTLESPADGWALCLYVSADGSKLQAAEACSLDPDDPQPYAVDMQVENRGVTPADQSCGFDIQTVEDVSIGSDGSFLVSIEEGLVTVEIQGMFEKASASGSAVATGIPMIDRCTLTAWSARPADD